MGVPYPKTVSLILISTREVGYLARNGSFSADRLGNGAFFILNLTAGTGISTWDPVSAY